jgi:hypothetical protein
MMRMKLTWRSASSGEREVLHGRTRIDIASLVLHFHGSTGVLGHF